MKNYDHKKIEKKWQDIWEKKKTYQAKDQKNGQTTKSKYYTLIEFPYPSGDGLHVGHPRPYIGMDVISRKRRMQGFNVLYPIGWDAFGLPTENYAIKTGKDPRVVTKENTNTFRRQIKSLGISFDWSREINTTDPKYYKWTQWIFLQFLKKGLAYKAKMMINWCPKDKIGLANEEVINGCCERCGTPVEKREKEQWMLAITKYADRLYKDLDEVDYLPQIKLAQRNWIGRSEGAEIKFAVDKHDITVFTTRPDTIFGATFIAVSPELAKTWLNIGWPASDEVKKYITKTLKDRMKVDFNEDKTEQEKTGISAGFDAINPANKEKIPVWIVNYVLGDVGTGAIMGVPAHDERDFEFAKKYNLPIRQVVAPVSKSPIPEQMVRKGASNTDRDAVMCIVKHWKKDEYLCLQWKNHPDVRSMVSGGIEKGEDFIETGKREIQEESGYINAKFIRQIGDFSFIHFYHQMKQTNMLARFRYLYFELQNGEQAIIDPEEVSKHNLFWKEKDEVYDFLSLAEKDSIWNNFLGKIKEVAYTGSGFLVNSGKFNNLDSEKAKKEITKFVGGKEKVTFKLRDWIFSRQRYWGEPIPIIHCEKCGLVPVPEKDLPVELPKVKNYQPTENGESPLANISKWVNVKCPKCDGKAKRETDTMPNWAGSSWYYLRYTDPKNNKAFASEKNLKYWTPVDWYNGGNEHTTLHLLYSRFWHKFLFDLKLVPTSEPYMKRTSHGLILAEGGEKMSKSKGNVINPDDIVKIYGADSLRLYEMFMGPFDQAIVWSTESLIGPRRFLERVWKMSKTVLDMSPKMSKTIFDTKSNILINKTIKKVTEDIEAMKFNTAISTLMIFINEISKLDSMSQDAYEKFLQLLAPFAPHIAEEIWFNLGHKTSIHLSGWPTFDENMIKEEEIKIVIQINGKVRAEIIIDTDETEETVKNKALKNSDVLKYVGAKDVKRVVYIKNRLINIVL